jgi:hypothetical protein
LDILAVEPFYGGVRRATLESAMRCSRHRWTLFKLPPRRIERRLSTAAIWFAEQLSRHWAGRVDLLFTSEAMNLADLLRLETSLVAKPSVVYFHSNQLPPEDRTSPGPLELVNLGTAAAATEVWFNSTFHLKSFFGRATALVRRHPELSTQDPLKGLVMKSRLMPPPVDCGLVDDVRAHEPVERERRQIFVETRDADVALLNAALLALKERGEEFELVTVGPADGLSPDLPRRTLSETDEIGQIRAMLSSGVVLSTKRNAASDAMLLRALSAGCRPVLPADGVYPEILPRKMHASCLYLPEPAALIEMLSGAMS